MIGRVVLLVEEVADDDLEIGIVVPRESFDPSGSVSVDVGELTETFSPLDRFAPDHSPRLLDQLCGRTDRRRLARSLWRSRPAAATPPPNACRSAGRPSTGGSRA